MEDLIKKLRDYSRFLELEDSIPYWESLMPELEARIEELKWNRQQKELELLQLKEPTFFQRWFGRSEEKKELLNKQIREITAAQSAAIWELEDLQEWTSLKWKMLPVESIQIWTISVTQS